MVQPCRFMVNGVFFLRCLSFLFGWGTFSKHSPLGGSTFSNYSPLGGPPPQNIAIKQQVGPPRPKSKGHLYIYIYKTIYIIYSCKNARAHIYYENLFKHVSHPVETVMSSTIKIFMPGTSVRRRRRVGRQAPSGWGR